jgi:hypothetical protein
LSTPFPATGQEGLGALEKIQKLGDLLDWHPHGGWDKTFPKLGQRLQGKPVGRLAPLERVSQVGVMSGPPSPHAAPPIAMRRLVRTLAALAFRQVRQVL